MSAVQTVWGRKQEILQTTENVASFVVGQSNENAVGTCDAHAVARRFSLHKS